jgi:hypothetical protein
MIQRFWPLVDPAGAPASYARFRELFVTTQYGVVGVREFPPGVGGRGDVDSGPLVAGLSASATTVAIGAATVNGDRALAATLVHKAARVIIRPRQAGVANGSGSGSGGAPAGAVAARRRRSAGHRPRNTTTRETAKQAAAIHSTAE